MNPPTNLTDSPPPASGPNAPPRYGEIVTQYEIPESPNIEHLVIDDGQPVDNLYSEKQMRLLTESLNSSWRPGRDFLVMADVGLFLGLNVPPIVPDVMLSMDVEQPDDFSQKKNLSYFIWERGKHPDLAIEIVSQRPGGEDQEKLVKYAEFGVPYYVIWDPMGRLKGDRLRLYELHGKQMRACALPTSLDTVPLIASIGLGLTLWQGAYEGKPETWLRWTDSQGDLIPTGRELADSAIERAEEQSQRAEEQSERADRETARADRLANLLRQQGIDPDTV